MKAHLRNCIRYGIGSIVLFLGLPLSAVHAQDNATVMRLLQSIQSAARSQDYAGVFSHQSANTLKSLRIVHIVDGTGERERLEYLDGEPREYVRHNETTQCLLPQRKQVIYSRGRHQRFPALLIGQGDSIDQHYRLRPAGEDRVAGRTCRIVHLEPRDAQRYGYTLCTDTQTGLLLKMQLVDTTGVVDQIAFTSVVLGSDVSAAQLASSWDTRGWDVQDERSLLNPLVAQNWRISSPDGYKVMMQLQRPMHNRQVNHVVLSDGLASISVFIEAMPVRQARRKNFGTTVRHGALSIHTTRVGDYGITVLGDVPPGVLQKLVQGTRFVAPRPGP